VLAFAYKNWEGRVPQPGELRPADQEIITLVDQGFQTVGAEYGAVHLRAALLETMRLASEVNKYLDQAAPWFEIKNDKNAAATTIYTAIRAIDSLKVLFSPILPFTSQQLHAYLGYDGLLFGEQFVETYQDNLGEHVALRYNPNPATGRWEPSQITPGQTLQKPGPLFRKLDESILDEERQRLGS
jgi:methionyl-tRNA synthetase